MRTVADVRREIADIDDEVAEFVRRATEAGVPITEGLETRIREKTLMVDNIYRRATVDSKTGVANAETFQEEARTRIERTGGDYSTLMIIDMDKFKALNDGLGHDAGDMAIKRMGRVLRNCIREDDYIVGRFGGDEFIVYLRDSSEDAGLLVAERLYNEFDRQKERVINTLTKRECSDEQLEKIRSLSLSIGITVGRDYDTMFRYADDALYRAKDDGRNRAYVRPVNNHDWLPPGYRLGEIDDHTVDLYRLGSVVNGTVRRTERIGTFSATGATRDSILQAISQYEAAA